jgi:hypothetical protein
MTGEQVTTNQNETTANVGAIYRRLTQVEPINFFKFFINPSSFSQSVENLFHLSFLIRDGRVSIEEDEEGEPILETADPPKDDDFKQGVTKIQSVFHFDMRMFRVIFFILFLVWMTTLVSQISILTQNEFKLKNICVYIAND